MNIIHDVTELQSIVKNIKHSGKSIGFVPTMGFLHEGHLTLVKEAKKQTDVVVMSIFVNPMQFGPNEDFDQYPRDLDRDRELAEKAGVDFLFVPSVDTMYNNSLSTVLKVEKRVNVLCGRKREGHFDGVVTIVTKLFNIVQPDKAFFGMKDAQQVAVIESLVEDYFLPVEIIRVPTVREEDGLAKSSRNVNLTELERIEAPHLYKGLRLAQEEIANGEKDSSKIIEMVKTYIESNTSGTIDYIEMYAYPELTNLSVIHGEALLAIAVKFSGARLIDNIIIKE